MLKVVVDNVNPPQRSDDLGTPHLLDGTVSHPALLRLLDYWRAKRGGRQWPSRSDVDPLELRFIVGNLILVDVAWTPIRFSYRLFGSNIAEQIGYDPTGQGPERTVDPEFRARLIEAFTFVATTGCPRARTVTRSVGRYHRQYDALTLPLSTDQQQIDMLMVGLFCQETTGGPAAA